MRRLVTISMVIALLGGCGDRKPPEKTVFDVQVQALKKARQVEDKLRQGAEQQRQEIDKSEAGAAPEKPDR